MKGVTGYQLAVVITIIIAVVVIALVWIFLKMGTESFAQIFGTIVDKFIETIREILGPWASFLMPGL